MKRVLFFLLSCLILFSFVGCHNNLSQVTETKTAEETNTEEKKEETKEETEAVVYPTLKDTLTPDEIASIPVATSDMTMDQIRQICVDFFRLQLSFPWTPKENVKYQITSLGNPVSIQQKRLYGGIPYQSIGSGNLYRMYEFYDPETGILDLPRNTELYYNACSGGAYWGWGRVINSANYTWTPTMTKSNGFIPLGEYDYDDSTGELPTDICKKNGEQVMYRSYAKLQIADCIVKNGHVRMASSKAHVVLKEDGSGEIDGNKSYVHFCDQVAKWTVKTTPEGVYQIQGGIDVKATFRQLFRDEYIPTTFKEFLGLDPIEKSEISIDLEGDRTTLQELNTRTVTANYGISDVFCVIRDEDGKEVVNFAGRTKRHNTTSVLFSTLVYSSVFKDLEKDKVYTLELSAQLSTGEKKSFYSGFITVE